MTPLELDALQRRADADGRRSAVGALVHDGAGRIFAQRRSATRKLFPNCWDIVGGHVEAGETLPEALARKTLEETGWRLSKLERLASSSPSTGKRAKTGSRSVGASSISW